jgi:hypothetical protein
MSSIKMRRPERTPIELMLTFAVTIEPCACRSAGPRAGKGYRWNRCALPLVPKHKMMFRPGRRPHYLVVTRARAGTKPAQLGLTATACDVKIAFPSARSSVIETSIGMPTGNCGPWTRLRSRRSLGRWRARRDRV